MLILNKTTNALQSANKRNRMFIVTSSVYRPKCQDVKVWLNCVSSRTILTTITCLKNLYADRMKTVSVSTSVLKCRVTVWFCSDIGTELDASLYSLEPGKRRNTDLRDFWTTQTFQCTE